MSATIPNGRTVLCAELRIVASEQGTTRTITLQGACDLASQQAVRRTVHRAFARQPECVMLDLGGLTFIDSSGIHVVVELSKRCAAQRIRLVIAPGPRAVQRVFDLCGSTEGLPFLTAT